MVPVREPGASFTIEKLQQTHGGAGFTKGVIFGTRRETVTYEIVVRNTGRVRLALHGFVDEHCDADTLSGGPSGPLAPGESATYMCSHRLTPEEQALGVYENEATVTATPPPGDGPPLTQTSNPVLLELPHDSVDFSCTSVTLSFANFPDVLGNTVTEILYVDRAEILTTSFSFDGPSGTTTISLELPPGHHSIDVRARWKAGGVNGSHDQHLEGGLRCVAE